MNHQTKETVPLMKIRTSPFPTPDKRGFFGEGQVSRYNSMNKAWHCIFQIVYRQLVIGNWGGSEIRKSEVEDGEMEESDQLKDLD